VLTGLEIKGRPRWHPFDSIGKSMTLNSFEKRIAVRIAAISTVLAILAGPSAWLVAKEKSEKSIVSLAMEESRRLIDHYHVNPLEGSTSKLNAGQAAQAISGGLFDIAEIYDHAGVKLAESMTTAGASIEAQIPQHGRPDYLAASYASLRLPTDQWILRVFVPLHNPVASSDSGITGYFEGVRIVPDWQSAQIFSDALTMALMVSLASLLCGAALFPVVVMLAKDNENKQKELYQAEIDQARNTALLNNMLPAEIAKELAQHGHTRPVRHESVTILFTDFANFTQIASTMPPDRMVAELNDIFAAFDAITTECGVEKIKTIGDAYMAVAGLPTECDDHAQRCVRAGLQMVDYLAQRNLSASFKWSLRVGIHTGPVVAGVVGTRKFAFDVWGDTVNIASRMESSGQIGRVNISAYTYDRIREEYVCEYRGKVEAKGKGAVDMYFVIRPLPAIAVET
jgi:class 3 adenylate cyclase